MDLPGEDIDITLESNDIDIIDTDNSVKIVDLVHKFLKEKLGKAFEMLCEMLMYSGMFVMVKYLPVLGMPDTDEMTCITIVEYQPRHRDSIRRMQSARKDIDERLSYVSQELLFGYMLKKGLSPEVLPNGDISYTFNGNTHTQNFTRMNVAHFTCFGMFLSANGFYLTDSYPYYDTMISRDSNNKCMVHVRVVDDLNKYIRTYCGVDSLCFYFNKELDDFVVKSSVDIDISNKSLSFNCRWQYLEFELDRIHEYQKHGFGIIVKNSDEHPYNVLESIINGRVGYRITSNSTEGEVIVVPYDNNLNVIKIPEEQREMLIYNVPDNGISFISPNEPLANAFTTWCIKKEWKIDPLPAESFLVHLMFDKDVYEMLTTQKTTKSAKH